MSDTSNPTPDLPPQPADEVEKWHAVSGFIRAALYLTLACAIGAVAHAFHRASADRDELKKTEDRLTNVIGVVEPAPRHLAPGYTDKDGHLLADPPADPAKLLNPDELVVAYGEDADSETQSVDWPAFVKYLAAATGRKVVGQDYRNSTQDIAALKAGKLHVVALHAADAPYVVNNAGFIPIAVLGTAEGAIGNHLDLAVRTASPIQSLADIRGHTLTCSTPVSITGYRAAVAVLLREASLRPDIDYFITFSLGQKRSVLGVAKGEFEVAALSDDKVQSQTKKGHVKPTDFRVIYESQVIPRLTIGYVYNLQPDLAAKITKAILDFPNAGGSSDEAGKPMRFYAIDYQRDFEFIRRIDDSFDPRFDSKQPKAKAGTASAPDPTSD